LIFYYGLHIGYIHGTFITNISSKDASNYTFSKPQLIVNHEDKHLGSFAVCCTYLHIFVKDKHGFLKFGIFEDPKRSLSMFFTDPLEFILRFIALKIIWVSVQVS